MVQGIVIPADIDQPLREIEISKDGSAVAAAVGGFMEAVDLPRLGLTVYVNEEGLIRQLPFNSRASFLWWFHVPAARQRTILVGDAVVTGLPDDDGADTDIPSVAHKLLLAESRFRVEVRADGDTRWRANQVTYPDYWEAIMWAMVLLERIPGLEEARVVPVNLDNPTAPAA